MADARARNSSSTSSGSTSPAWNAVEMPTDLSMPLTNSGEWCRPKLVATAPGMMVTARIGSFSSSARRTLQMELTAALVAP